jgi:hypothetical protein
MTELRKRLSLGSFDWHTEHEQPTTGTPVDVPVPRKVIFISLFRFSFVNLQKKSLKCVVCLSK